MNIYQCPICGKEFKEFPSQVNKTGCCCRNCFNKLPRPTRPIAERFWEKVKKAGPNDCWEWKAHRNDHGYGTFRCENGCTIASRVAWELTFGPIPSDQQVLHNCPDGDNRACCNPAHLWLGTLVDNNLDRQVKGRSACGTKINRAKLTDKIIRDIRSEYDSMNHLPQRHPEKITQWELAERYNVCPTTISKIITKRIWKHV